MIFYFSATGNCLDIARRLEDNKIFSIPQELKKEEPLIYEDETIGIISPDYAAELPQIVRRFLQRAEFKTKYLYVILTYGKADSIVAEWVDNFGKENNIHFNYINTLLMVDNYLPSFDMEEELAIDKKIPEQLENIRKDINDRKEYVKPSTDDGKKLYEMVQIRSREHPELNDGSAIAIDINKCVGCGLCAKVCPIGNFYLKNGKATRHANVCEYCLACAHACPQKAIYCSYVEKNKDHRYRNSNVTIKDIIASNQQ